jgi:hypothetical protein
MSYQHVIRQQLWCCLLYCAESLQHSHRAHSLLAAVRLPPINAYWMCHQTVECISTVACVLHDTPPLARGPNVPALCRRAGSGSRCLW